MVTKRGNRELQYKLQLKGKYSQRNGLGKGQVNWGKVND